MLRITRYYISTIIIGGVIGAIVTVGVNGACRKRACGRVRPQSGEVAVAHCRSWHNCVVHTIVHILLVILGAEEKEKLVVVVVEVRSWNDKRAANITTGIEVLGFGTCKTGILILWIVGVKVPAPGIRVSLTVKLLPA